MIKPQFPYTESQILLSSDRVMLYAKKEAVLLLGKQTIGLSTPGTINLDSKEKVIIHSPKIELGSKATEQVILGTSMVKDLEEVILSLKDFVDTVSQINETNFAVIVPMIRHTAGDLSSILNDKYITIRNNLSKITYTE